MLIYWLWLHLIEDITSAEKRTLLEYFHDPEELYRAKESTYRAVVAMAKEGYEALSNKDLSKARELAAMCSQRRIGIVTIGDSGYPARLKQIPDAPMVLYYRGRLPNWELYPAIGIVGTRRATAYGLQMSGRMGAQIAACGGMVVSGGASGVDSAAMEQALLQLGLQLYTPQVGESFDSALHSPVNATGPEGQGAEREIAAVQSPGVRRIRADGQGETLVRALVHTRRRQETEPASAD